MRYCHIAGHEAGVFIRGANSSTKSKHSEGGNGRDCGRSRSPTTTRQLHALQHHIDCHYSKVFSAGLNHADILAYNADATGTIGRDLGCMREISPAGIASLFRDFGPLYV